MAYQGKLVTVQDVSGEVANGTGTPHAGNPSPYIPTAKSPPGRPAETQRVVCCAPAHDMRQALCPIRVSCKPYQGFMLDSFLLAGYP